MKYLLLIGILLLSGCDDDDKSCSFANDKTVVVETENPATSAVPEPSTYALLITGLALLYLTHNKQRRTQCQSKQISIG